MSPRPRRTDKETEDHARRIIEATFRVIATTGDAEPAVRPILDEAGVSREAFYRCFESKDDLMRAVLAEGRRLLAESLARRVAQATTPEAKVRAWVAGVMRQAEAASAAKRVRPFAVMGVHRTAIDPSVHGETDRILCESLVVAIEDGVTKGLWSSPDPARDALMIQDYVLASQRRHLVTNVAPSRATINQLAEFAVRALHGADGERVRPN